MTIRTRSGTLAKVWKRFELEIQGGMPLWAVSPSLRCVSVFARRELGLTESASFTGLRYG